MDAGRHDARLVLLAVAQLERVGFVAGGVGKELVGPGRGCRLNDDDLAHVGQLVQADVGRAVVGADLAKEVGQNLGQRQPGVAGGRVVAQAVVGRVGNVAHGRQRGDAVDELRIANDPAALVGEPAGGNGGVEVVGHGQGGEVLRALHQHQIAGHSLDDDVVDEAGVGVGRAAAQGDVVNVGRVVGAAVDKDVVGDQSAVQPAAELLRAHEHVATATGNDIVDDDLAHAGRRHGIKVLVAHDQAAAGAILCVVPLAPELAVVGAVNDVALHERIGGVVQIDAGVVVVVGDVVFQGDVAGEAPGDKPLAIVVVDQIATGNAVIGVDED